MLSSDNTRSDIVAAQDIDLTRSDLWIHTGDDIEGFSDGTVSTSDKNYNSTKVKLTLREFTVERKYITFHFRTFAWRSDTGFRLFVDGELQFLLTDGIEGTPEKKYALDMSAFLGRKASIVISDCGTWERVYVSGLKQTDTLPQNAVILQPFLECEKLDITLDTCGKKYVNIPICKEQHAEFCNFSFDGKLSFNLALRLAKNGCTDYIASVPIGDIGGKTLRIYSDEIYIPKNMVSDFRSSFSLSDKPRNAAKAHTEKFRPALHYMPIHGGNGDMVGLFTYRGKYHLGYLFDPGYDIWNLNASWAFSESGDLFSWTVPEMVLRKGDTCKCSSGCGFTDYKNASGLKDGSESPILLFYSKEHQEGQRHQIFSEDTAENDKDLTMRSAVSVAYSTDGGKTFKQYAGNPIFLTQAAGGHDPEVVYYEPEDKYILVIHDRRNNKWGFDFYESKDLLSWSYMSSFPGWETPNFYPLPLDGSKEKSYWILQQCDGKYTVGNFDGRDFMSVTEYRRCYDGAYAMRTFDAPDGRRILFANLGIRDTSRDLTSSGGMTLPLEVTLRSTEEGPAIFCNPAKEMDRFIISEQYHTEITADRFNALCIGIGITDIEICCSSDLRLYKGNVLIFEYTQNDNSCRFGKWQYGIYGSKCKIRIVGDFPVISCFICDGRSGGSIYLPDIGITDDSALTLCGEGLFDIRIRVLRSPFEDEL